MIARQVHALMLAQVFDDYALFQFQFTQSFINEFRRDVQLLRSRFHQLGARVVNMPFFGDFKQNIQNSGFSS